MDNPRNDSPITKIKDMFKRNFPLRIKKIMPDAQSIRTDRGRIVFRDGIPKLKLYSNKQEYSAEDMKYSQMKEDGHEVFYVYTPNDDETHPVMFLDPKRTHIEEIFKPIDKAIDKQDWPTVSKQIISLKDYFSPRIWFEPVMSQSTKLSFAIMQEDRHSFFNKSWWDKWREVIVPIVALIVCVVIVYMAYNYVNEHDAKMLQGLSGCIDYVAKKPPV